MADLAAPPLTHEEFASLRDGANGSMHGISIEHKKRLIELGYIEELLGGLRLTSDGRGEDRGRQTVPNAFEIKALDHQPETTDHSPAGLAGHARKQPLRG